MTDIAWYPFYVGDYARKTAHLSLLEHGAYRLLLDHYYATRHPLPNDPAKLYRICRARSPSERKAVLSVVAEFFTETESLMRNEKCDSEIDKQLKYSESQSAKAKLRHSNGNAVGVPRARVPQPQPHKREAKASPPPTPYPDWLPTDAFFAFKEMRSGMRARLTPKAEQLAISQLDKLRHEGHDPKPVIEQSILRGWKSFYPLKGDQHETTGNHSPPRESKWIAEGRRLADKYRALAERQGEAG